MFESHPHGKDTRTDSTVIRYLVTDDRTAGSIHDKPNIGLDAADFDIGLIGSKYFAGSVIIVINEGLDTHGGRFTVVGDALMGDVDTIEVFQSLFGFSKRETKVYMQSKAERHCIGIELREFKG